MGGFQYSSWKGYCATKVSYAGLRTRMRYAFEEKAHELAETTRVLLGLTKESAQIIDELAVAYGTPTVAQGAWSCLVLAFNQAFDTHACLLLTTFKYLWCTIESEMVRYGPVRKPPARYLHVTAIIVPIAGVL